jgi:hypothetical protein
MDHVLFNVDYCTISTERSRGVTRDAREHYPAVFTGEILV